MGNRGISEVITMRTFIAFDIYPDERMRGVISDVKDYLKGEPVRWVRMDPLHVTLAFLGDTSRESADLVCSLLDDRLKGFGEFDVTIRATGYFGRARAPKVIWAGIDPDERLLSLHQTIHRLLEDAGIKPDSKPFRPHVTLGRIRNLSASTRLESLPGSTGGKILMTSPVREIVFYRSILNEQGPIYEPLFVAGLDG
ncbi:MAG: RNA 2',3'-cyclic phosphodiesterase [Bacteroidales bacterium]|jgi:2'-5' RNA ligase|nr:RNA 2',3'-cyclic phosphodiesterase [Bacteroidales bacterium]